MTARSCQQLHATAGLQQRQCVFHHHERVVFVFGELQRLEDHAALVAPLGLASQEVHLGVGEESHVVELLEQRAQHRGSPEIHPRTGVARGEAGQRGAQPADRLVDVLVDTPEHPDRTEHTDGQPGEQRHQSEAW